LERERRAMSMVRIPQDRYPKSNFLAMVRRKSRVVLLIGDFFFSLISAPIYGLHFILRPPTACLKLGFVGSVLLIRNFNANGYKEEFVGY
jgi:hypothetical protein